MLVQTDLLMNG